MRMNILITLLAVFLTANSFSQSRFKITYHHGFGAEWAGSTLNLQGDQYLANSYFIWPQGQGLLLILLDGQGNVLDVKEYKRTDKYYQALYTGSLITIDSNYYTGGAVQWQDPVTPTKGYGYPFILKVDKNRDTVWMKHYDVDTFLHLIYAFRKTKDNNFLIAGAKATALVGNFDYFLMKIDTAGNLLWQKTYGSLNINERASTVEEFSDGKILLSGVKVNNTQTIANPWILMLNDTGAIEWQRTYTRPALNWGGGHTKPAKTGGFYLMGIADTVINPGDNPNCGYIARMEANGNFRWLKIFNNKYFTQIWDFHELDNGDVVFCGDKDDSATQNQFGYIARIDSFGNLKWWRTYHEYTGNNNYLSCIRPAPDGGFVACGSAFGLPNGASQDAWIIKTDSMGCVVANCYLGVEDIAAAKAGIKVYPNPATHEVSISLYGNQPFPKDALITAYDITGKRVARLQPGGQQKITIPVSSWNNGTYLITVQRANGDISTAKVNIVK